ncbi:MAG: DUF1080 domain-containing protein [Planctomycetota bacterium]
MRFTVKMMLLLFCFIQFALGSLAIAEDKQTVALFDGKTLEGWHGDERFWRVEDGVLIGETSKSNPAPHNTFLIHDEEFADFELAFSYKVSGFNSGVQYRSVEQDDFVVRGYQADFEARWHDGDVDKFSGMFFEENGRMFLGQRGTMVVVESPQGDDQKPLIRVAGKLGDPVQLETAIKRDDWNEYVVIAKGFQFTHIINGRVMCTAIDNDVTNRKASGVIAFQLHSGKPMRIELKDIRIRALRADEK